MIARDKGRREWDGDEGLVVSFPFTDTGRILQEIVLEVPTYLGTVSFQDDTCPCTYRTEEIIPYVYNVIVSCEIGRAHV